MAQRCSAPATQDEWLRSWGFRDDPQLGHVRNPFGFLSAENDRALEDFYIPLPDQPALTGPGHLIVLGPRGGGKTALWRRCRDQILSKARESRPELRSERYTAARSELYSLLHGYFNLEELRGLCFRLGFSSEDLLGGTLSGQARELITYAERRGRLRELLDLCKADRPNIEQALQQVEAELWPPPPQVQVYTAFDQLGSAVTTFAKPGEQPVYILLDISSSSTNPHLQPAARCFFTQIDPNKLNSDHVYLKAFLPLELCEYAHDFPSYTIRWRDTDLEALIRGRLSWASGGNVKRLADISSGMTEDPGQAIARARSTPRDVLALGQALIDCHMARSISSHASHLDRDDLRQVLAAGVSEVRSPRTRRLTTGPLQQHFHLRLTYDNGRVQVRALHANGATDCVLPPYGEQSPARISMADRATLGTSLYDALFGSSETRTQLERTLEQTATSREPVRVHLHFDYHSASLLNCPWELIHDGGRHLVQNGCVEIVRHLDPPGGSAPKIPSVSVRLPLPIVYMAPRPTDQNGLSAFEETELSGMVQHIKLEKVLQATTAGLSKRLGNGAFYVFHFDGYGRAGHLIFEREYSDDARATSHPISAIRIETLLSKQGLRVAVLSACESAVVPDADNVFSGICQSLSRAGVPGVIGMQSTIDAQKAAQFVKKLYATLTSADHRSLVEAVGAARRELAGNVDSGDPHEKRALNADWFAPVLYLRCADHEGRFFAYDDKKEA